jgi:hypothetical protein
MWVGGQGHAPTAVPLGRSPGTQCIGSWVNPVQFWTSAENLAPRPSGFGHRIVQPAASRYTD